MFYDYVFEIVRKILRDPFIWLFLLKYVPRLSTRAVKIYKSLDITLALMQLVD